MDTTNKTAPPRATDADLGDIQKSYTQYLKDKLAGKDVPELSAADQTGIRNILKDNGIVIEPDLKDTAGHQRKFGLTLVDAEVDTQDILGAAGIG